MKKTQSIKIILLVLIIAALGILAYAQKTNKPSISENTAGVEGSAAHPTTGTGAATQGKLNINVICESALAYMTFKDGASADNFVAECKEGKHPEVIERYKAQMNLGDGAAI